MATEKRLIRADETVDAFTKWLTSTYDGRMPGDIVAEIPTVDAVAGTTKGGSKMTDAEKVKIIRRLAVNLSPIDFTDQKIGLGVAHALCVAIEIITDQKEKYNVKD